MADGLEANLARVLYVDLSRRRFWVEDRRDLVDEYLGGVGLAIALAKEEGVDRADPLGPDNTIIFAVGPFNAAYPLASKTVAVFRSPLTGTLGESYAGGRSSVAIKLAGYAAIVIRGMSETPVYLAVHEEQVKFRDASALWGTSSSETVGRVIREREPNPGLRTIMRIGLAGEKLVKYACVITETYRHFGRLGLGAVFGSKKLKAVVVSGRKSLKVPDRRGYREVYDELYDLATRSNLMQKYHDLGTPMNVLPLNEIGALPTRNLKSGRFEQAEDISGEAMAANYLARRTACSGCPVACIHLAAIREPYPHEKYFYKTTVVSYDYELIYALGSMLGVGDPVWLLRMIHEVERLGLDAMSTGVALAWATEALERGLVKEEDTVVKLKWGDAEAYRRAIALIVEQPNDFYKALAQGVERASEIYGGREFAMAFGGNEMPGYHTGPAAHIGFLIGGRHSHLDNGGYSYDQKVKELPEPEKVVDDLMKEEAWRMVLNSLVICLFARGLYKPEMVSKALAPLGVNMTPDELRELGWKIYRERMALKVRMGFNPTKLRVPERILETPSPHGQITKEYVVKALEHFREKLGAMGLLS